ncbi:Protein of unknown function DUF3716 [Penicillium daleae]|uniref:Uncharacterized protein n=1 Tax=Penicillium daleae TaxID=63821 RepID=A0AAD6G1A3_9EURO|nr:Protein of unknown function DUF3716 [Penicillium daleae]KAJ5443741.1 Protein of unknown function DUF3716 [Penicillium daleae]
MVIGPPEDVPAVGVGAILCPAGPWATFIKGYPLKVAATGELFKSSLLESLAQERILWEPLFRLNYAVFFTPTAPAGEVVATRARVEAATIQIVGRSENTACRCCKVHRGPFVHCVRDIAAPRCGTGHRLGKPCSLSSEQAEPRAARRL